MSKLIFKNIYISTIVGASSVKKIKQKSYHINLEIIKWEYIEDWHRVVTHELRFLVAIFCFRFFRDVSINLIFNGAYIY